AEPTVEPTEAPAPKSDFDVQAYLESLEAEASVIEERLYLSDMTQNAMNSDAKELYELWDSGLNDIWRELHNVLPSDQMETLLSEQKQWIDYKEAKILAEGEEYAGGSMRPLVENSTGATLTEVRCYVLAKYFDKPFSSIGRSADVRQFAYMVGMKEGEFLSYIGSPTADECKQGPEYGFLKEENVLPFALEGMDGYLYWLIENGEIVEVIWLLSSSNESDSNRFVYELPELCKAMVSKDWYEERENTMKGEHAPGYYQWPYHGRSLQIDAHQTGTIIFGNYTLNEVMTSNSRY
ncbi:MAG: lysozyme inhibitor LprI family protein, partial [Eubacteriales bacterium]|nr:lysozyme inhibitor LprI family protein [Eubacteriales bacterium]